MMFLFFLMKLTFTSPVKLIVKTRVTARIAPLCGWTIKRTESRTHHGLVWNLERSDDCWPFLLPGDAYLSMLREEALPSDLNEECSFPPWF